MTKKPQYISKAFSDLPESHVRKHFLLHNTSPSSLSLVTLEFFLAVFTGRNEVVAKVIFLHLSVILFTGGPASVHAGMPPPSGPGRPPQTRQTPPPVPQPGRPPDQADTPPEADSRIRSTSGRYASYWNAFLLNYAVNLPMPQFFKIV